MKVISSVFNILLVIGLLTLCAAVLSGCGNREYKNTVSILDGEIYVNDEKCEITYSSEPRSKNDSAYYEIHANIDWDLKSFKDDAKSYKEAAKEVITFYYAANPYAAEGNNNVMIKIINKNKQYHYNRIALWVSYPTQFFDHPHIAWSSNNLSNDFDEIWSP